MLPLLNRRRERASNRDVRFAVCALARVSIVALAVTGCAQSTHFLDVWRAPGLEPEALRLKIVGAFFVEDEPESRRVAEVAMARELSTRGILAVAGHKLLSLEETSDPEGARERLAEKEIDAVVVVRVISRRDRTLDSSKVRVAELGDFWSARWASDSAPQADARETAVTEVLVYSLPSGDLIWAGLSETSNPRNTADFVHELAKATWQAVLESRAES